MVKVIHVVGVCFQGDVETIYSYKNHLPDLQVGDLAVVQVESGVFKVVTVKDLKLAPRDRKKATKWLVDRVQLDKYNALSQLVPPPEPEE